MFPAKISNLFSTATARAADATIPACVDNSCTNPDCLDHGLRRPSAIMTPSARHPTTKELPHVTETSTSTDNVWTNIALASPPPAITFSSFDGAGDKLTMSGAVDASNLEKGYQAGMVHTAPNIVIGIPADAEVSRRRRNKKAIAKALCVAILIQAILGVGLGIWLARVRRSQ